MIEVLPLNRNIITKAQRLNVAKKLEKCIGLLKSNLEHPGLHVELLEPKSMGIWSFRVDRKIRALFIFRNDKKAIEILTITVHYN